jgi:hypothetical protein
MSDVLLQNNLLLLHCAKPSRLFGWILSKVLQHPTKSEPKLMWFAAITPHHVLLLDHSMSSICDQ